QVQDLFDPARTARRAFATARSRDPAAPERSWARSAAAGPTSRTGALGATAGVHVQPEDGEAQHPPRNGGGPVPRPRRPRPRATRPIPPAPHHRPTLRRRSPAYVLT